MLPKIGEEHNDIVDELFDHATFMVSFILLIHMAVYNLIEHRVKIHICEGSHTAEGVQNYT